MTPPARFEHGSGRGRRRNMGPTSSRTVAGDGATPVSWLARTGSLLIDTLFDLPLNAGDVGQYEPHHGHQADPDPREHPRQR